jgi:hypothetical protein
MFRCPSCGAVCISVPNAYSDVRVCRKCPEAVRYATPISVFRRAPGFYRELSEIPYSLEAWAAHSVAAVADWWLWDDLDLQVRHAGAWGLPFATIFPVLVAASTPLAAAGIASALNRALLGRPSQQHLLERLAELLAAATDMQLAWLGPRTYAALLNLLPLPGDEVRDEEWAAVEPIASVLTSVEYWPAIRPLAKIARGSAWDAPPPHNAQEAARRGVERLRTKLEMRMDANLLLRACEPVESDSSRLLRRASIGGEPARQLLRTGSPPSYSG